MICNETSGTLSVVNSAGRCDWSNMTVKILTIDEVSERTHIPTNSLRWMRQKGTGPRSGKLGRRVVYRESDVDAWIDERFAQDAS